MAYSTVNVVARSPIDELVSEISNLLRSGNIDSAYDKYQKLSEGLGFEIEIPSRTLEKITMLNNYFLNYLESSKRSFSQVLSRVDSAISRANLSLENGKIEDAKTVFYSIQSYYDKVPTMLFDEKMFLHDKLSVLRKDIISKENEIMQSLLTKTEIKFNNLKKMISDSLSQGSINEAQRSLSVMIDLHDSLPKNQSILKMRFHKEILLFQYELGFARNVEYNSERLDSQNKSLENGDLQDIDESSMNSNSTNIPNQNYKKLQKILKNIPKIGSPIYSSEPENPDLIFDDPDEGSIDEIPRVAADYNAKEVFNISAKAIKDEFSKKNDYDVTPYTKRYYDNIEEDSQDVYAALKEDNPNNPLFNYVSPILENTYIKRKFDYDERLSVAIDAYNGKDYQKAKELFDVVLKEAPDNVKAQQMVSIINDLISSNDGLSSP